MLCNPWVQNVSSNFLTLAILIMCGWLYLYFSGRSRLLRFFGATTTKRLILYLSNLRVVSGGALGVDNQPRSFSGSALPLNEAILIPIYQRLFNFVVPGIESQPGILKWLLVSDVSIETICSPVSGEDVEKSAPFIAVGSPAYNGASGRIEESYSPLARFNREFSGFLLQELPVINDPRCSFVQKVFNQTTGQIAFYVAGISSLGTNGAAYFLATQWRYLERKYPGTKPFCVVLRITNEDWMKHEILLEKG